MTNQPDAELLHSQVAIFKLQKKTTEELTTIWIKNDHTQWTNQDFEIIKKILIERIGQVPEQQPAPLHPNVKNRTDDNNNETADKTFSIIIAVIAAIFICLCAADQIINVLVS